MGRLKDKAIIVTGAARGIGREIAAACLAEGAKVLLVDVRDSVVTAASELNGKALVADVTAPQSASAAITMAWEAWGRIDGLVNNAARLDEADLLETSEALWDTSMAVNLKAPYQWTQAVVPHMLKRGTGSIVNISSIEAALVRPRHFAYVIAKSGLNSMSRAVAAEFGRKGIRCNTISPGSIKTEMFNAYVAGQPALEENLIGRNYAGRLGLPAEIALAAVYLLSDESPFLNGHDLVIDGARTVVT